MTFRKKGISNIEFLIIIGVVILLASVLVYIIKTNNIIQNQELANKTVEKINNIEVSFVIPGEKNEKNYANIFNIFSFNNF